MKKLLIRLFLASVFVFTAFLVFYYSIDRLYILRFNLHFGKVGNVVYSPPRLSTFFIANLIIGFLSLFFIAATKLAEFGESKFFEKGYQSKFNSKKLTFIPLCYAMIFIGGLIFSSYQINHISSITPILKEREILNLINEYREEYKKVPFYESDFSCQTATEKLRELRDKKMTGLKIGGKDFKNKNGNLYAYNYIKNVGREQQVLFWWQQDLDLNKILQITNFEGTEITKGCVRTLYGSDYSIAVFVASDQ